MSTHFCSNSGNMDLLPTYLKFNVDDRRYIRQVTAEIYPDYNMHKCLLCWTVQECRWVEHNAKLLVRAGGSPERPPRALKFPRH
jgi:hypothetical protein